MRALIASLVRKRMQAGNTAVEFAFVLSVFLMLVFAVIQMGLAVYNYNSVCEAAREAVRYAVVHSPTSAHPATTAQIQQVAINAATAVGLAASNIAVNWPADANLPSLKDAQVKITYNYTFRIPFMSQTTLNLTSTSQMLVSQ